MICSSTRLRIELNLASEDGGYTLARSGVQEAFSDVAF